MAQQPPRLALVAGEASGDLLASLLLRGLAERWPGIRTAGIGGPKMAALGFEPWWPSDKLAVRGYFEVLRHYREIAGIRDQLATRLLADPPDAFVGVDAPDFNLGLEARLKQAGIKAVHFVCPSVWAWRGGRLARMSRSVDHVLCLFPFEPALLREHGIAATYVGHPRADAIPLVPPRAAARAARGVGEADRVLAVLPGSRRSEIQYIAPAFIAAAALMQRQDPALRVLLPVAPGLMPMVEPLVAAHGGGAALRLVDGRSHDVMAACDVVLVASGTATLEAALFKRPMVIGYRMHALSWQIMKRMRYQPWVGLPNILAREFLVPELLQADCTPEALAAAARAWLDDAARSEAVARRFDEIHHTLRQDTARRATDAIENLLG
jgi:lipid-A-disaccharide synthase